MPVKEKEKTPKKQKKNTQPELVMMSWLYVVTNKCIVSSSSCMKNGSLGSVQMDTRARGRGGRGNSMFGSLDMCRSAW